MSTLRKLSKKVSKAFGNKKSKKLSMDDRLEMVLNNMKHPLKKDCLKNLKNVKSLNRHCFKNCQEIDWETSLGEFPEAKNPSLNDFDENSQRMIEQAVEKYGNI